MDCPSTVLSACLQSFGSHYPHCLPNHLRHRIDIIYSAVTLSVSSGFKSPSSLLQQPYYFRAKKLIMMMNKDDEQLYSHMNIRFFRTTLSSSGCNPRETTARFYLPAAAHRGSTTSKRASVVSALNPRSQPQPHHHNSSHPQELHAESRLPRSMKLGSRQECISSHQTSIVRMYTGRPCCQFPVLTWRAPAGTA